MKTIFDLKVGLMFYGIFVLLLWLYYTFDLYKKQNFYFSYYDPFIVFKYNFFFFVRSKRIYTYMK